MYLFTYVYIYTYIYIHRSIYIYIYIDRYSNHGENMCFLMSMLFIVLLQHEGCFHGKGFGNLTIIPRRWCPLVCNMCSLIKIHSIR